MQKEIKKVNKVVNKAKKITAKAKTVTKKLGKLRIRNNRKIRKKISNDILNKISNPYRGHCVPQGTFRDCLFDPKNNLARIPQCTSKTVVCKIVKNFSVTASSTNGNLAFIFVPQAINDTVANATGTSCFWLQNAGTYTPTVTETTVGYVAQNVGSIINQSFTAARCVSARIELTPNVSLTTAAGRGIIAMSKVRTANVSMSPTSPNSTTNYSQLQLQDTMLASPYVSICEVSKLQGLSANWVPHEAVDLLDFPLINFPNGGDLASRHPTENFVYGLFTGLPTSCSVNVRLYMNIELLPDSQMTTSGLFPLIAEFSKEKVSPLTVLRDVYVETPNFTHILTMNNRDSN